MIFPDLVEKPVLAHRKNFDTLKRAFANGHVALLECTFKTTGEAVAVICAMERRDDEIGLVPFALMMNGNPYEILVPPPDGSTLATQET